MRFLHLSTLAGSLAALLAPGVFAQAITNGVVTLEYAPYAALGIELVRVTNAGTGVSIDLARADAWELTFRRIADGGLVRLRPSQIAGGSVALVEAPAGDEVTATWTAPAQGELPALAVKLTASALAGDDVVSFGLEVDPEPSATLSLYRLELLLGADPLGDPATETLASPFFLGTLYFNPLASSVLLASTLIDATPTDALPPPSHPGLFSMQWNAYYRKDPGGAPGPMLFWGTRDQDDNLKPYGVELCVPSPAACAGPAMIFGVQHYPANNLQGAGAPAALPFPTVLTALRGDWYDAARYYRSWVISSGAPWVAQGPMKDNREFSQHARDAEMIGSVLPGRCATPSQLFPPGSGPLKAPSSIGIGSRSNECVASFDYGKWSAWTAQLTSTAAEIGVESILQRALMWDYNANLNWLGDWFPIRAEYQAAAAVLPPQFPFSVYFGVDVYHPAAAGYGSSYVPEHAGISVASYMARRENGELIELPSPLFDRTLPCGAVACAVPDAWQALCLGTSFPSDYTRYVNAQTGASGAYLDAYHLDPRLCYDAGHIAAGDHPQGDGRFWTKGKRKVIEDLKQSMRTASEGDPEYFVIIEGVSEAFLSDVEVTWNRYSGFQTSKQSNVARVPLFQTVYNDYQLTGNTEVISEDKPVSPGRNRSLRQAFAAHVFQGGEPFAGAVLGAKTLSQQIADPVYEELRMAVEMIKNHMSVLKLDAARELIVFGQRLRDPHTDSPVIDTSVQPLSVEKPGSWIQPFVYTAVFGDPATPRIGVLMLNWTDDSDPLVPVGSGAPGDQMITVDLDLSQYGFTPGATYELQVITSPLVGPVVSYNYPGGTQQQTFPVPELSAVLAILGPEIP